MYSKSDFKCQEGMYYVGDVVDVDGNPWVDEETLELILLELNNGAEVKKIDLPNHICYIPFSNNFSDPINFICLN
jgi:hypothetical protein